MAERQPFRKAVFAQPSPKPDSGRPVPPGAPYSLRVLYGLRAFRRKKMSRRCGRLLDPEICSGCDKKVRQRYSPAHSSTYVENVAGQVQPLVRVRLSARSWFSGAYMALFALVRRLKRQHASQAAGFAAVTGRSAAGPPSWLHGAAVARDLAHLRARRGGRMNTPIERSRRSSNSASDLRALSSRVRSC